jgi:hypothetical protein
MLFSIIEESKNLGCYEVANIAFAILLDVALDSSAKKYKLIWESNDNYPHQWERFDELDTYYDLLTISDGIQSACIPVPLLRKSSAKALMSLCELADKHESHRCFDCNKWQDADKLIVELWEKLIKAYPEALNLSHKYLGCSFCKYFAGKGETINCFLHPEGLKGRQICKDFEFQLDIKKLAQEATNFLKTEQLRKEEIERCQKEAEEERLLALKQTANLEIPDISQKIKNVEEQISIICKIDPRTFKINGNFSDCIEHWIGLSKKGAYYTPESDYFYSDLWRKYPSVAEVSGFKIYGIVTTYPKRVNDPAGWMARYEVSLPNNISLDVLFKEENKTLSDKYFVGETNPALRGVADQFISKLIEAMAEKLKSLNSRLKSLQEKLIYWQEFQ